MSNAVLELILSTVGSVDPDNNVIFEPPSQTSDKIEYDNVTGMITFNEPGSFLVNWWVATETTPHGSIKFALRTSQDEDKLACTPIKTGQISGNGSIDVIAGTTLSLINASDHHIVFSRSTQVKAHLLVTPISSANMGTIIPFSTGDRPNLFITDANGERSWVTILGFGNATEIVISPNDPIKFFTTSELEAYYAFSMPTDGTITALSAKFILSDLYPQIDNTITAQLYHSPTFDNTFIPVPGATVALGTVLGNDPFGTVLNGIVTGLNVPVPAQASLLLIFYNTNTASRESEARGVMQGGLLIT